MAKSDVLPAGAFQPIASNWCHSVGELKRVDFEWTIHEYEFRRPGEKLTSATFPIGGGYNPYRMSWHLILEDKGISIYHHSQNVKKDIRVRTAFVNAKREKVFSNEIIVRQQTTSFIVNNTSRETLLQKSTGVIVDKNLIIYCEVETYDNVKNVLGNTTPTGQPCSSNKEELANDFGDFFENQKHSDIKFIVGDQTFFAHKIILAAKSPVFAAMFQHPSNKENITGIVNVPDVETNVFKELLRYIYTGQVPLPRMDQVAAGLLAAADKYLLENLKRTCGDHLMKRMTPENCIELLSLGENDPAYYLRTKAIDYICQYPAEVIASASWKELLTMETAPRMRNIIRMLVKLTLMEPESGRMVSRSPRK